MRLRWKRIAAAIDLILVPMVFGVLIGVVLINTSERERTKYLRILDVAFAFLFQRDFVYSPGRHILGLQLIDIKTGGQICFYRGNILVNFIKATVRNLLLFIPFVLVIGYILETIMVLWKGYRLMDRIAGVQVIDKSRK